MTIKFVEDYDFHPNTYSNHMNTMESKVSEFGFPEFKHKLESEAPIIVLPRTFGYKMSIYNKESKNIMAFFNYAGIEQNTWKLVQPDIYLQLVLPYYNRGTYHESS